MQAATQGPLDQLVDGAPLTQTFAATGYSANPGPLAAHGAHACV